MGGLLDVGMARGGIVCVVVRFFSHGCECTLNRDALSGKGSAFRVQRQRLHFSRAAWKTGRGAPAMRHAC